jgi:hypothetical protein
MPSTITHAFIGLDTINKLDNKPKEIINNRLNNFKIYCQNTDIYYFYHIFLLKHNKVQKMGHRFHHEHVFDSFNLLIEDNKINKDLELFTLIAGFITHYQADTIIHPFINSFPHYVDSEKNVHFEVETYLDNYYVNTRLDSNHKQYNNTNFVFNYTEEEIVKEELDKLFVKLFKFPNMGEKYYRSLKEMKFAWNYCRYDKYGIKRILYKILDFHPFDIQRTEYLSYHFDLKNNDYYLNLNHKEWENNGEKCTKSLLDLYDEVLVNSSYIINELYKYIFEEKEMDTKKLVKNLDYGTGLEIKKRS